MWRLNWGILADEARQLPVLLAPGAHTIESEGLWRMGLFDGTPLERPVLCDRCGQDIKTCSCIPAERVATEEFVAPEKQRVKVRAEKRKRGKIVTVVSGLTGSRDQQQELFTTLKNALGAGGSTSADSIELQGSHVDKVSALLQSAGYRVK